MALPRRRDSLIRVVRDERRICAVLGSPIAHSLSPALHEAAYRDLGLDWTYERHEIGEDGLAGFVARCGPRWRGLSLTMPLKQVALALGEVDVLAAQVGAGNTLIFEPDGVRRIHNTDVDGLVRAVRSRWDGPVREAVVLGSGATARSALASLGRLGCQLVTVVARTPARAEPLRQLGTTIGVEVEVVPWSADVPRSDLVLATTVAGAADPIAEPVAGSAPVVFDVTYDPWPTRLAAVAEQQGRIVVNGLDLLVHQAVLQVELMTGRTVAPEVLLSAGQAALYRRQRS